MITELAASLTIVQSDGVIQGEQVTVHGANENRTSWRGWPVARLAPILPARQCRAPGTLRGKIRMAPDFDETSDEIIGMFHGEADAL